MSAKKNKVKFNICNVHYALITVDDDGEVTFGTPVAMPGAVSLSLEPNGEPSNFYADGYAYYTISNNMGYEGDLELAMVPESFRTDVLKESLDDNSVLVAAMCCITALRPDPTLSPRPMRRRSRCRRKRWPSRRRPWLMGM